MPNDKSVNQRIKKLRLSKNIPQREIAELLGVKVSTYSQMERKGSIPAEKLKLIAKCLNVPYTLLLDGKKTELLPDKNIDTKQLCDVIVREIEKQMQSRYCFLHDFSEIELGFIKMISCLPRRKRTAVYEYARDLLKNKINI